MSAQALPWKGSSWRGALARELEPIAMYRLGVDIRGAGRKVPGRSLGRKISLWVTKECCCRAVKEDRVWLDHSSAQLSVAPLCQSLGSDGEFLVSHL
jgi:hypothetical protein